ncbi:MAG: hypothetical protein WC632_07795 [Candidatus Margulisiibacteriota bacterium]
MKILVALLSVVILVSVASAELLTTANPIGQGKWAFAGAAMQDLNVTNNTSYNLTSLGCYAAYGATDKLDLYLNLGTASMGGLPSVAGVQLATTLTALGLTAKYAIIEEGKDMPVSVGVGGGYKALTTNTTAPAILGGNTTANGSQILAGVGVSKVIIPFVPYGGLVYRSSASGGATTSTQLDLTVGSAIAWSKQGAVFVEYTMQSITPNGGTVYTSGQIGLSVAYAI